MPRYIIYVAIIRRKAIILFIFPGDGPSEEWHHQSRDTAWLALQSLPPFGNNPVSAFFRPTLTIYTTTVTLPATTTIVTTVYRISTVYATPNYEPSKHQLYPPMYQTQAIKPTKTYKEMYTSCSHIIAGIGKQLQESHHVIDSSENHQQETDYFGGLSPSISYGHQVTATVYHTSIVTTVAMPTTITVTTTLVNKITTTQFQFIQKNTDNPVLLTRSSVEYLGPSATISQSELTSRIFSPTSYVTTPAFESTKSSLSSDISTDPTSTEETPQLPSSVVDENFTEPSETKEPKPTDVIHPTTTIQNFENDTSEFELDHSIFNQKMTTQTTGLDENITISTIDENSNVTVKLSTLDETVSSETTTISSLSDNDWLSLIPTMMMTTSTPETISSTITITTESLNVSESTTSASFLDSNMTTTFYEEITSVSTLNDSSTSSHTEIYSTDPYASLNITDSSSEGDVTLNFTFVTEPSSNDSSSTMYTEVYSTTGDNESSGDNNATLNLTSIPENFTSTAETITLESSNVFSTTDEYNLTNYFTTDKPKEAPITVTYSNSSTEMSSTVNPNFATDANMNITEVSIINITDFQSFDPTESLEDDITISIPPLMNASDTITTSTISPISYDTPSSSSITSETTPENVNVTLSSTFEIFPEDQSTVNYTDFKENASTISPAITESSTLAMELPTSSTSGSTSTIAAGLLTNSFIESTSSSEATPSVMPSSTTEISTSPSNDITLVMLTSSTESSTSSSQFTVSSTTTSSVENTTKINSTSSTATPSRETTIGMTSTSIISVTEELSTNATSSTSSSSIMTTSFPSSTNEANISTSMNESIPVETISQDLITTTNKPLVDPECTQPPANFTDMGKDPEYLVRTILKGNPKLNGSFENQIEGLLTNTYQTVYQRQKSDSLSGSEFLTSLLVTSTSSSLEIEYPIRTNIRKKRSVQEQIKISHQSNSKILHIFNSGTRRSKNSIKNKFEPKLVRRKRQNDSPAEEDIKNLTPVDDGVEVSNPDITVRVRNTSYDAKKDQTQVIYTVFEGRNPILSRKAVKAMENITVDEMQKRFGYDIVVKAEGTIFATYIE